MNHFEYGFFDELEKMATVDDGTLATRGRMVSSKPSSSPRRVAERQAAVERGGAAGERNAPAIGGVLGSSLFSGTSTPIAAAMGTLGAGIGNQQRGLFRGLGEAIGGKMHDINKFMRVRRANKYVQERLNR